MVAKKTEEQEHRAAYGEAGKLTFTPLADKVLIQARKITIKSGGGLLMPDGTSSDSKRAMDLAEYGCGLVMAIGPQVKQVKRGDVAVLMFGIAHGKLIWQGEEYMLCREYAISGVLDQDNINLATIHDLRAWVGRSINEPPDIETYMTDEQIRDETGGM